MHGPWSFSIDIILNDSFFIANDKKSRLHYVWNTYLRHWFVLSSAEPKYWVSSQVLDVLCDFSIIVCNTFNFFAISHTVIWLFVSIMVFIWSSWILYSRPERWCPLSEKSPQRNSLKQFWDVRSLSLCEPHLLSCLYKNEKVKFVENACFFAPLKLTLN